MDGRAALAMTGSKDGRAALAMTGLVDGRAALAMTGLVDGRASLAMTGFRLVEPHLFSQLFNPPSGVAVPSLATGAVPEVLCGFETAGGAAVAHQGFGGFVKSALH